MELEKKKLAERIMIASILVLAGVVYRIVPHPANFAPVAAIAIFSGFYFRRYAIFVPMLAMLIGDFFIGFYDWKIMLAVYAGFFFSSSLGIFLRRKRSVLLIVGLSLFGSSAFYLISNLAVWAFGGWYSRNLAGLGECYIMALPFFRNTLAGDLFYSSVIFGCYELLARPESRLALLHWSEADNN